MSATQPISFPSSAGARDVPAEEDLLSSIWVRAHPFGNAMKRDTHREWFDSATNFFDGLLPQVPINYYHNHTPDGYPSSKPIAIGVTDERRVRADGVWYKPKWFKNIPAPVKRRLMKAIANGTLRCSPTVVPDFHTVENSGHVSHWLTGSIAVFDAEGDRQPANPDAIGVRELKALFKAANLKFPAQLEGGSMAKNADMGAARRKFNEFLNAIGVQTDSGAAPLNGQKAAALWEETFGEGDPDEEGADKGTTEPADNGDTEIRLQMVANQMKASMQETARLRRELETSKLDRWYDGLLAEGKVLPAERPQIIAMALQFTMDDAGSAHPTMKFIDPLDVTKEITASRADAFKSTIESRPARFDFGTGMKAAGFDSNPQGEADKTPMKPAEIDRLLAMSSVGSVILADRAAKR